MQSWYLTDFLRLMLYT